MMGEGVRRERKITCHALTLSRFSTNIAFPPPDYDQLHIGVADGRRYDGVYVLAASYFVDWRIIYAKSNHPNRYFSFFYAGFVQRV